MRGWRIRSRRPARPVLSHPILTRRPPVASQRCLQVRIDGLSDGLSRIRACGRKSGFAGKFFLARLSASGSHQSDQSQLNSIECSQTQSSEEGAVMRLPSKVVESQAPALMLWITFRCVFWSRVSATYVADTWHHKPPKHEELLSGTLSGGQDSHTGSCRPLPSRRDRAPAKACSPWQSASQDLLRLEAVCLI